MSLYNVVVASNESTVVAEYQADYSRSDAYQSEAELERELIRLLQAQGYEYLLIHDEAALVANLRRQLEALNDYVFSDAEWHRFFAESIASSNEGIVEKTRKLQTDHVQNLKPGFPATHNETGGRISIAAYSSFCFSRISPTLTA